MHPKDHLGRLFGLLIVLSMFAVQPAFAAAETCFEISDRAFTVRECLELDSPSSIAPATAPIASPVLAAAAHELSWNPELLSQVSQRAEASGVYTRTAFLDGEAMELRTDRFRAFREGSADHVRFGIDLEGQETASLLIETVEDGARRAGGSGALVVESGDGRSVTLPIVDGDVVPSARGSLGGTKSSFYMGCYIDTPAFDTYQADACFHLGTTPSIAAFKVFLPYTPQYVVWSQPSSSCSSVFCSAPISPGQTVYGYAYWVINNIPTGPVSATARYIFEPGF
ncbi:MAG: hypothetical protein AAGC60_24020 [Acidobacteriota bacterium]